MTENDLDLEVQSLTLQLQLKVGQERIQRQLDRVQHKIRCRGRESAEGKAQGAINASRPLVVPSHVSSQEFKRSSQSEVVWHNGLQVREHDHTEADLPEKGDHMRILNPKKGQCSVGIIIDFCSDGKVKILTNKNTTLTRLPKKVRYYN